MERSTSGRWFFAWTRCLALLPAFAGAQMSYPGCPDLKDQDFKLVPVVDKTLHPDLTEPMKMDLAADGRLFWIERAGAVKRWDPVARKVTLLAKLNVFLSSTRGGIGLSLDPDFSVNGWIYVGYTPNGAPPDRHQISRFTLVGDKIQDEKPLLKVPLFANTGNHATAAMAWDAQKNLYISMGDAISPVNVDGYAVDGYAPIEGRYANLDARRTAGNTKDLNGKILRIHPEANGTYSIPAGNLFPADTAHARPEIYSMGHRNPYAIWYDKPTGWIFLGDVGPDALREDPLRGPAAQDEFNVVKSPGNYGWPFLVGPNLAYNDYDYVNMKTGPKFDPNALRNVSPFNTGLQDLPPARPSVIAYGHDGKSPDQTAFPLLKAAQGGASIGGPVYRYNPALESRIKLPPHFEGKWFIADHTRLWFLVATLDAAGDKAVDIRKPFPGLTVYGVTGMTVGPEGALYLIEYGEIGYSSNSNQRISRVEYQGTCLPTAVSGLASLPGPRAVQTRARLRADLPGGRVLVYPAGPGAGAGGGLPRDLWGRAIREPLPH